MFVLQVDVDWILLAYVISVLRCAVFGAGCAQDLSAKVHEDPGNTVAVFGFFGHVRAARLFHACTLVLCPIALRTMTIVARAYRERKGFIAANATTFWQ